MFHAKFEMSGVMLILVFLVEGMKFMCFFPFSDSSHSVACLKDLVNSSTCFPPEYWVFSLRSVTDPSILVYFIAPLVETLFLCFIFSVVQPTSILFPIPCFILASDF